MINYIESKEKYPFGVRNYYDEAMSMTIKRHTGQEVTLHIDLELTTLEKAAAIRDRYNPRMTDWYMHNESESYAWVAEKACKLAEEISNKLAKTKFECHESWGVHYTETNNASPHTHWLYQYAFGYYVKAPEYSPIVFPNANFEHNPKAGDLIVFPGHVTHEVKPVSGERIMIAGNLRNTHWDAERTLQNSSMRDVLKYNNGDIKF